MRLRLPSWIAVLPLAGLAACGTPAPMPGTPEFAAAEVSRGYDCGLTVDRAAVLARLPRDERPRFLSASGSYAVQAYKAPRRCDAAERIRVQGELATLSRR
jgi:hypothetical protein